MEYMSSFYWQQEENAHNSTSLLLQQVMLGKNTVLLGGICTDKADNAGRESSYLTGQLLGWFYGRGLTLFHKGGEKEMREMQKSLGEVLNRLSRELATCKNRKKIPVQNPGPDISGILCIGCHFVVFYCGEQRIYALNTKFLRPHMKCLAGGRESVPDQGIQMKYGILQPGVGILLATEPFYRYLTDDMLRECLAARQLRTQLQLDKRLEELGRAAEHIRAGEAQRENNKNADPNMGAVLLVTK